MAAKKAKEITVVAELTVSSSGKTQTVRSFDRAWHLALELPRPAEVHFIRFVQIDKPLGR